MIDTKTIQTIRNHLFRDAGSVFTILDGASVQDLRWNLVSLNPQHVCLYRGELEPDMAEVAPYLAILEQDSGFTDWVLGNGWGRHWGIFGFAQSDLQTLRKHFRKFLMVYDDKGKSLYFRYYDPRVWRAYLPTCNGPELKTVFGPVQWYLVEDEDPSVGRKVTLVGDELQEDVVGLSAVLREAAGRS